MKTTKIRLIAYVTFGVVNLMGFVYLVGQDRYRVSTAAPEYYGAPAILKISPPGLPGGPKFPIATG